MCVDRRAPEPQTPRSILFKYYNSPECLRRSRVMKSDATMGPDASNAYFQKRLRRLRRLGLYLASTNSCKLLRFPARIHTLTTCYVPHSPFRMQLPGSTLGHTALAQHSRLSAGSPWPVLPSVRADVTRCDASVSLSVSTHDNVFSCSCSDLLQGTRICREMRGIFLLSC